MRLPVTQLDIARKAGVHNATVSLSLRNSPLISEATRTRIQAIARSLGYQPDPALRALVKYRQRRKCARHETFLYVTNWEQAWSWRHLTSHDRYWVAAQRRAVELGYQLEHQWLGEPNLTAREFDRLLLQRDITGLVLASQRNTSAILASLEWSRLSAVQLGNPFPGLAINRIATNPDETIRMALQQILANGYARVGMILPRCESRQAALIWSGAFLAENYRLSASSPIPVLHLPEMMSQSVLSNTFTPWYQRHRPDVILGLSGSALQAVQGCGLRVPRDVAYVDLCLDDVAGTIAGVWENCERLGALAIEMLVQQIAQGALGLSKTPTLTLINGAWREGASLPARNPPMLRRAVV